MRKSFRERKIVHKKRVGRKQHMLQPPSTPPPGGQGQKERKIIGHAYFTSALNVLLLISMRSFFPSPSPLSSWQVIKKGTSKPPPHSSGLHTTVVGDTSSTRGSNTCRINLRRKTQGTYRFGEMFFQGGDMHKH